MKLDTQLWGLSEAAGRAAQLRDLGLDGVFTFEGPHDVFTPLVLAAGATDPPSCWREISPLTDFWSRMVWQSFYRLIKRSTDR